MAELPPPPPPPSPTPEAPPAFFAPWGLRVAARLIDGVVFLIALIPVGIVLFILASIVPRKDPEPCTVDGRLAICEYPTTFSTVVLILFLLAAAVAASYIWFWRYEGATGQTPGRRTVEIKVVDARTHEPIGGWRAFGRYMVQGPIGLLLFIGPLLNILWPLWDKRNQTWHDKVVNSVVIRA